MNGPVDIGLVGLLLAGALVAATIALAAVFRLRLGKTLLIGTVRTVAQLLLVGWVLLAVFEAEAPLLVLLAFVVMLSVATWTAARRVARPPPGTLPAAGLALTVASATTAVVVTALIVQPDPWWSPRYFIPIAGMITASAMNAAALGAERLVAEVAARRDAIEELLALGASPRQAVDDALRASLRAALIPSVNALLTVGIVQLPGMMTGQMIAGADPFLAARYQIVVMFMLVFANAVAAAILGSILARRFFTEAWQLRAELLSPPSTD